MYAAQGEYRGFPFSAEAWRLSDKYRDSVCVVVKRLCNSRGSRLSRFRGEKCGSMLEWMVSGFGLPASRASLSARSMVLG